jgi:hypothetical protein
MNDEPPNKRVQRTFRLLGPPLGLLLAVLIQVSSPGVQRPYLTEACRTRA